MSDVSPDIKLLQYLRPFGIGNYQFVYGKLIELFPIPDADAETIFFNYHAKIERFLEDLAATEFIKLKDFPPHTYYATIQPKGIDYLDKSTLPPNIHTHVVGNNAQIVVQSPSASLNMDRSVRTTPVIPAATSTTPKKPKIRLWIEMAVWIISIITGLILIQQYFFPHIFDKQDTPLTVSPITVAKKEDRKSVV